MADTLTKEFQEQTLALMRAQQEAYLEAVRSWQQSAVAGGGMPPWPDPPTLDTLPNATEIAEVSYEFAARMLEEQSRFMKELGKQLSAADKER